MALRNRVVTVKVDRYTFVKYHTKDLVKFAAFLNRKFPGWRWMNVYDKETRAQLASFTCSNPPTAHV